MIPFTQYLLPNGRRRQISIDRPAPVEAAARKLIEAGVDFEAEILITGVVSLTASYEEEDIAIELAQNGPEMLDAVDRLVEEAASILAAIGGSE